MFSESNMQLTNIPGTEKYRDEVDNYIRVFSNSSRKAPDTLKMKAKDFNKIKDKALREANNQSETKITSVKIYHRGIELVS